MKPDCRYFPTILIVLLAVFNDGAMIALSKDRVIASPVPNHWDLKSIFIVGELPCLAPLVSGKPRASVHSAPSSWSCKGSFIVIVMWVTVKNGNSLHRWAGAGLFLTSYSRCT